MNSLLLLLVVSTTIKTASITAANYIMVTVDLTLVLLMFSSVSLSIYFYSIHVIFLEHHD